MLRTDWVKIGTEGRTIDGRNIEREWLESAARNYSPALYTASINSEHFFYPGLGHVESVKAEEDEQGRLALYAQLAITAEFLGRNQNKRQLFFSMELDPDFPEDGETYLGGLAVTDIPASQGLAPQMFSARDHGQARRFFNSAAAQLNDRGLWTPAEPAMLAKPSPAPNNDDKIPGWASRFLASIAARRNGGATSTEDNRSGRAAQDHREEAMTKEELARIEALENSQAEIVKTQGEIKDALEKLTASSAGEEAGDPKHPEPGDIDVPKPGDTEPAGGFAAAEKKLLSALDGKLKPITEQLGEFQAFMDETRATETLEVPGIGDLGENSPWGV